MFTYPDVAPSRNFTDINYALFRVRQISRDTRENPPYSLTDEEWTEFLEDTKINTTYQVYTAVLVAIGTNPERLASLSEASGAYTFSNLEDVKKSLKENQSRLNAQLNLTGAARSGFVSVPVIVNGLANYTERY